MGIDQQDAGEAAPHLVYSFSNMSMTFARRQLFRSRKWLEERNQMFDGWGYPIEQKGENLQMGAVLTKLAEWMSRPERGFSAASEQEPFVFGARRPGFPLLRVASTFVHAWVAFMQAQGITRVLCLLPSRQLDGYADLLGTYRHLFGEHNVLWVPIADFHLAEEVQLIDQILPFLVEAVQHQEKTVVHCSGGGGRTGHVLAAWLVSGRGMSNEEAIAAVKRQGRNARESRDKRLDTLLDRCREAFSRRE